MQTFVIFQAQSALSRLTRRVLGILFYSRISIYANLPCTRVPCIDIVKHWRREVIRVGVCVCFVCIEYDNIILTYSTLIHGTENTDVQFTGRSHDS